MDIKSVASLALKKAREALRENLRPGLFLNAGLLLFVALYFLWPGARRALAVLETMKEQWGFAFAAVSYIIAAAVLPELLRIVFFQSWRPRRKNLWNVAACAPLWGAVGMIVDGFYRLQGWIFGHGMEWQTVVAKVAVDQFVFSPFFCNPLILAYLTWKDAEFRPFAAAAKIVSADFLWERVLPVQVAGWIVWIPGVMVIYLMPPLLQIPVAVMIQCFWVLVLFSVRMKDERQASGQIRP